MHVKKEYLCEDLMKVATLHIPVQGNKKILSNYLIIPNNELYFMNEWTTNKFILQII